MLARVAGPARAEGVGWVAACDIAVAVAVAAAGATVAFGEVRIGVVPAVISVTVAPRSLPEPRTSCSSPARRSTRRAAAVGLVAATVPAADVDGEVVRYAAMVRLGARSARSDEGDVATERPAAVAAQFAGVLARSSGMFAGAQGQEGIRECAEKRRPRWT